MDLFGISEVIARLTLTYLAEAFLGLIMYYVFRYFSRVYVRRFLRTWSKSWLSFSVYMFSSATLTVMTKNDPTISNSISLPLAFMAQLGSYFHIIFILIGSYQLVFHKPFNRRLQQNIIFATIILAFITVVAFSFDVSDGAYRYLLRAGSRSLVTGFGFLFAGVVVWVNPKFTRGIGQRFLMFSFLAFSGYQFFYLFIVFSNLYGTNTASLPGSSGLINLTMITMMSMSMVMWLLENEREKLNRANQNLDSFLYSTSHDLRAPITSILGLTYIGQSELKEEKAKEYMAMIEERVKKLNMILSDILSLSKAKKLEVRFSKINFDHLLDEVTSYIQFDSGSSSIRLDFQQGTDHVFHSDHHQMKIILGNLITNAVKYHRLRQEDPYIKVTFDRTSAHKIVFSVEDNGQGIPPENISKIFNMFYRGTDDNNGTGLGLYIVKEALSKVKGEIEVHSVVGKGSKFTVTLDNA